MGNVLLQQGDKERECAGPVQLEVLDLFQSHHYSPIH